jgi:hypothetical protein
VLVLDENRVLATLESCGDGCEDVPPYGGDVVAEAGALALRDRTHASVAYYSICNEFGCGPASLLANDTALAVIEAIDTADGSRAITGNMGWQGKSATAPHTPLSDVFTLMVCTLAAARVNRALIHGRACFPAGHEPPESANARYMACARAGQTRSYVGMLLL